MKGYKRITIDGKQKRLHRYVMECFIGRALTEKELVHHIDGDKTNNNIENLKLITRSQHLKIHCYVGEKYRFKTKYAIDKDMVIEMFKTMSIRHIAKHFGCSAGAVNHALRGNKKVVVPVFCKICGDKAAYKQKQLCIKHYQKEYHANRKNG
jgi:hypothetical protein